MEQIICRGSDQKAKVASVLLFTDGLANRGIKNMKDIIDAMRDPISSLAKPGVLDNAAGMARPLVSMGRYWWLLMLGNFVALFILGNHGILIRLCMLLLLIDSKTTSSNATAVATASPSPSSYATTSDIADCYTTS